MRTLVTLFLIALTGTLGIYNLYLFAGNGSLIYLFAGIFASVVTVYVVFKGLPAAIYLDRNKY